MPGVACVEDVVRKFIAENFLYRESSGEFLDTQSFLEAGLIDSTGILELVFFLETTFHIHVTDDEVVPENLDSIQQIAAYVQRKTAEQNTVQEIPNAPRALSA